MGTVNILHTGDLHLDCRFSNLSLEKSKLRRNELKMSFKKALEEHNDADIVLIAGDILDNSRYTKDTINFLSGVFSSYPDKTFFVSLGNHDSYQSPQGQELVKSLPGNVVIFSDKAEYMELEELKTRVYGMSFSSKNEYESLIENFTVIDDDYINILLLHADVVSKNGESKYNPITEEQLEKSGFDYVALGHTHDYSGIKLAGKTYYAYCGVHEPHGFDECGEKGVICGKVGKGFCRLSLQKTAMRKYSEIDVDVTGVCSLADICQGVSQVVDRKDDLYKINLTGILSDGVEADVKVVENSLDAFYVKVENHTRRNYNLDTIALEPTLRGHVAKNVLKELENCPETDVDIVCSASDYIFELIDNGGR